MMKKCPACGKEQPEEYTICDTCGSLFEKKEALKEKKKKTDAPENNSEWPSDEWKDWNTM